MEKSYPTSTLYRAFTLGIYRKAASIQESHLKIGFHAPIEISGIRSIKYKSVWYNTGKGGSYSYVYRIQLSRSHVDVQYTCMEGYVLKELLDDLKTINPDIQMDESIDRNLAAAQAKAPLRFNFTPPPQGRWFLSRDAAFAQKYPSLDMFIKLTILALYIALPFLVPVCFKGTFIALHGAGYGAFRDILAGLSGFSAAVVGMNFLFALGSQYLGHKVTAIAAALAAVLLAAAIWL